MSELEIMLELAYLYGIHNKETEEVEELDDFVERIKEHAANLPAWFEKSDDSPLQALHDYFRIEVLGQGK